MLGFEALGRLALGEIPQAAQTITLTAASGAYAVTGNATAGLIGEAAQPGGYSVTGYPVGLAGKVDAGAYALTGNVIAFSADFVASGGSYAVTGNSAVFAPAIAAASGQYSVTGSDAAQRFATDSGSYTITGSAILLPVFMPAESGSYAFTLGNYELRRTGYDYPPDQYGIGHIKLAMEEARRLSQVVKPTPYPTVARFPRLIPQPAAPAPMPQIGGLIDNSNLLDQLAAQRHQMAAQQAQEAQQQARNRALAVLLLAA
jgi:hypothetical protein